MTTINVYLTFDGKCEEAFYFYKSVFGGEFRRMSRFSEMPPQEGMPPMSETRGQRIMHISLPISSETILMGSDHGGWGSEFQLGNNFSIAVNPRNEEEATVIFNSLADGGHITMPLQKTFWNAFFGSLTDQYGINWMVNYELGNPKA